MTALLTKYLTDFRRLNKHRKIWTYSSIIIIILFFVIFLNWNIIEYYNLQWILVAGGMLLSIAWWYWTLLLVKKIIEHKIDEVIILEEIINDFKDIKNNLKESSNNK